MNKMIIIGTFLIIILMIGIPTYLNIKKDHEDKLISATEKRIAEAAKRCFIEKKCTGNQTSLQELYDNNYLEEQINPVNKKYYESSSNITYIKGKIDLDLR